MKKEFRIKNLESRIRAGLEISSSIFLGSYLLITFSRWLQPALFHPTVSLIVIIIGILLVVTSIVRRHS